MLKRAWQEKVPIACKTEKTPTSVEFDFSPRELSVDNTSRVRLLIVKQYVSWFIGYHFLQALDHCNARLVSRVMKGNVFWVKVRKIVVEVFLHSEQLIVVTPR